MKLWSFILMGIFLGFFLGACERDPKQPGYQIDILTDMVDPVPYESFGVNPNTPDGKTLQNPVAGTIPRGFMPFSYGKSEEDAVLAGQELQNPLAASQENLARGKQLFENFCMVCHGPQGQGDGPLIPKFPNPPSFTSKRVKEFPSGRLYYVITRGGTIMPAHNTQIDQIDRWKIVLYVQQLQQGQK